MTSNDTLTFSVAPLGPISRCRRLTNLSLLRTIDPILMMSEVVSSCNTRMACNPPRTEGSPFTASIHSSHSPLFSLPSQYPSTNHHKVYTLCVQIMHQSDCSHVTSYKHQSDCSHVTSYKHQSDCSHVTSYKHQSDCSHVTSYKHQSEHSIVPPSPLPD